MGMSTERSCLEVCFQAECGASGFGSQNLGDSYEGGDLLEIIMRVTVCSVGKSGCG